MQLIYNAFLKPKQMKNLSYFIFLLIFITCSVQKNSMLKKDENGDLIGRVNKKSFSQQPYKAWFDDSYESYFPDSLTTMALKKELKGVKIKGFMGFWCSDSKREIPHFYKVLKNSKFNLKNLELIAVNKQKKDYNNSQEKFDIKRVPTFILYRNKKELGRYVEYARVSLEKDLLKILTGKNYKHSYED